MTSRARTACAAARLVGIGWAGFLALAAFARDELPRQLFGPENEFRFATLRADGVALALRADRLAVRAAVGGDGHRGVIFPLEPTERDLSRFRFVEIALMNRGAMPVVFTFWAMTGNGWGGVSTFPTGNPAGREELAPGAREVYRVDLHARYSGPEAITPAIDAGAVRWLELICEHPARALDLEIEAIVATGVGPGRPNTTGRTLVPPVEAGVPAPGRRVVRVLAGWSATEVRHVLTLPREWRPDGRYPVIVEYTGNRFFHKFCHSTGRTADGKLAYGLARGENFICLNLPFISTDGQREQTDGWGDIERAAEYALAAIEDAVTNFGADAAAIVFTGFSRGDYAANYLALRDDRIAAVWSAFLVTRDPGAPWSAPGEGWRGVGRGWDERAVRRGTRPWFHVPARLGAEVHADVEFLEDRPSTVRTRQWLDEFVASRRSR